MRRLAILSTHPIQYNAPLFRILHEDDGIDLQVFFSKTWDQVKFDPDFQREVVWDISVSEGYPHATHDASSKSGKKKLARAIREFKPDALLVYGWNFPGHLAIMRAFHGSVPIWFRGDSNLLNPLPFWKKTIRRLTLTWVYQHIDFAFPVGTANEAYYLWSRVPNSKLIRAPHAVDNDYWAKNDLNRRAEAEAWRARLSIPKDAAIVGYAGKLEPLKQVGPLMKAVIQTPNTHLIIAGTGPLEKQLKKLSNGSKRVHFLGFVNQSKMPVFYRLVDVLALVSYSETWGLCINEALASGTRCLVSDRVGCHQDILSVASRGAMVPWNNPQIWSAVLKSSLSAPSITDTEREAFKAEFNMRHLQRAIQTAFTS